MVPGRLPDALKAFAEREFAGERLVWAARPDVRIAALCSFAIYLFAIPWTTFSAAWISVPLGTLYEYYSADDVGAPKEAPIMMMWAFAIFGTPFVAIGIAMLAAPFRVFQRGSRTLYVLTDRRIAILVGERQVSVTSITPGEIHGLKRKEGPDGRGTLILSLGYVRDSEGDRVAKASHLGVIDDVREVERLVRELKEREPD